MSWLSGLLSGGYKNPADSAMGYYDQIPSATQPYMQPYFNAGTNALGTTQNEYNNLISNPSDKLNSIGEGFHQSPGFQFALQQALQGAGHAAAAGGMAGSPQHEQQNMGLATNLADQDYETWLNHALGLYGQGLGGEQSISQMGQQSGQNMADTIAKSLAQQGQLAYTGQQNQNQNRSSILSNIGGAIGSLAAFTPFSGVGNAVSNLLGNRQKPVNNQQQNLWG